MGFGNIGSALGTLGGAFLGGPVGAGIGGSLGGLLGGSIESGGGGNNPPKPATPQQIAENQTKYNKQIALYNTGLNNPNIKNPYYVQTNKYLGTKNGIPQFESSTVLSPDQQKILDTREQQDIGLGALSNEMLGKIPTSNFNANNLPALQSEMPMGGDYAGERKRVEDALFSRYAEQFAKDKDATQTQLANQGIIQGSEAYNREMDTLNRAKNDALTQAIIGGGQEQSRLFNMALQGKQFGNQARTQGLNEALRLRQLPLNEFNALRSGVQVANPNTAPFQGGNVGQVDLGQAYNNQFNAKQDAFNYQTANKANMGGGIFDLGQALGGLQGWNKWGL